MPKVYFVHKSMHGYLPYSSAAFATKAEAERYAIDEKKWDNSDLWDVPEHRWKGNAKDGYYNDAGHYMTVEYETVASGDAQRAKIAEVNGDF